VWAQTGGKLDAFVCATGTGGTLAGTGRFLKEASGGRVKVFLADPPGSVLHSWVQTGKLERTGSSITEGIGQGRVTDNLQGTQLDGSVLIEDARTVEAVYTLLRTEGLYIGASSALNCVAAGDVARKLVRFPRKPPPLFVAPRDPPPKATRYPNQLHAWHPYPPK